MRFTFCSQFAHHLFDHLVFVCFCCMGVHSHSHNALPRADYSTTPRTYLTSGDYVTCPVIMICVTQWLSQQLAPCGQEQRQVIKIRSCTKAGKMADNLLQL